MSSIPVWLRIAFAALLLMTIAVAFVGRPPRHRPRRRTWRRLAGAGAACYGIGCGALLMDDPALSAALVGVGVETLSVVAWLGRGLGDEGDGDEGGGPEPGTDPPGGIWDEDDDRAFWHYVERRGSRSPRVPTPV
jgi:hypothetical protein